MLHEGVVVEAVAVLDAAAAAFSAAVAVAIAVASAAAAAAAVFAVFEAFWASDVVFSAASAAIAVDNTKAEDGDDVTCNDGTCTRSADSWITTKAPRAGRRSGSSGPWSRPDSPNE